MTTKDYLKEYDLDEEISSDRMSAQKKLERQNQIIKMWTEYMNNLVRVRAEFNKQYKKFFSATDDELSSPGFPTFNEFKALWGKIRKIKEVNMETYKREKEELRKQYENQKPRIDGVWGLRGNQNQNQAKYNNKGEK